MQVPLSDPGIGVSSDLLEPVKRNANVGEPGESGVPEIVPTQVFVAELRNDLVPVRCLPQHTANDPLMPRAFPYG